MDENSIEFEEIQFSGDLSQKIEKSPWGREEFRIPVLDFGYEAEINKVKYKISNLSTYGFQILLDDIKQHIIPAMEIDFVLLLDNVNVKGRGIVKYIEKVDLNTFGAGILIKSFYEKDKDLFYSFLKELKSKVISGYPLI